MRSRRRIMGTGLMRLAVGLGVLSCCAPAALAKYKETDQVVGGIISGLLGQPQPSPEQVYSAQERDRLVSTLQSGEYVTSRQGETVEAMVYGIPLTRAEHVYVARPIQPSQASAGR